MKSNRIEWVTCTNRSRRMETGCVWHVESHVWFTCSSDNKYRFCKRKRGNLEGIIYFQLETITITKKKVWKVGRKEEKSKTRRCKKRTFFPPTRVETIYSFFPKKRECHWTRPRRYGFNDKITIVICQEQKSKWLGFLTNITCFSLYFCSYPIFFHLFS